ncbi:MAG: methyltransferase domain-containing protein [Symploca sp. SIO1B1]|nr:methyltransferase domain-containing protein [Symploca sp. SIO1B1]
MSQILEKLYDHRRSNSWATKLRKKRLSLLKSLITSVPTPLKILDIGGKQAFWENAAFFNQELKGLEIILLNLDPEQVTVTHPSFQGVVGTATDMKQFADNSFDVVFSNSVIEHVGDYNAQRQMANEVMRVGKRYFVQTPNLYFPVEPHFVFPFFQFLPISFRVWLLTHFDLGWMKKVTDKQEARRYVTSIRLLNKQELINLFPDAKLYEEKLFGLNKSLIVYGGW